MSGRKISADAWGVCIGHLKNKNSIYFLHKYNEEQMNYWKRHGTVYKHSRADHFTLSGLKHRRTIIFCNSLKASSNSSGNGKFWGSLLSYIFFHSRIFSETWLLEKKTTSIINTWSLFFFNIYQRQITLYCHLRNFISMSENNPAAELLHAEWWKISFHHAAEERFHLKCSKLTINSVCSSRQHCLHLHRSGWIFCLH